MKNDSNEETPLDVESFREGHGIGDATGRVRIWVTLRDRRGRVIPGNRTKTITCISTVGEVDKRIQQALFGKALG